MEAGEWVICRAFEVLLMSKLSFDSFPAFPVLIGHLLPSFASGAVWSFGRLSYFQAVVWHRWGASFEFVCTVEQQALFYSISGLDLQASC